jgi:hypothetical protein
MDWIPVRTLHILKIENIVVDLDALVVDCIPHRHHTSSIYSKDTRGNKGVKASKHLLSERLSFKHLWIRLHRLLKQLKLCLELLIHPLQHDCCCSILEHLEL